jgi:hypothetical protein
LIRQSIFRHIRLEKTPLALQLDIALDSASQVDRRNLHMSGVSSFRVVPSGFAPTDVAPAVTFSGVGLFAH